jgi:hypothetical protein
MAQRTEHLLCHSWSQHLGRAAISDNLHLRIQQLEQTSIYRHSDIISLQFCPVRRLSLRSCFGLARDRPTSRTSFTKKIGGRLVCGVFHLNHPFLIIFVTVTILFAPTSKTYPPWVRLHKQLHFQYRTLGHLQQAASVLPFATLMFGRPLLACFFVWSGDLVSIVEIEQSECGFDEQEQDDMVVERQGWALRSGIFSLRRTSQQASGARQLLAAWVTLGIRTMFILDGVPNWQKKSRYLGR